CQQYHSDPTF
nr:immunoglobulin light chain junction region [Macaca mulatta]